MRTEQRAKEKKELILSYSRGLRKEELILTYFTLSYLTDENRTERKREQTELRAYLIFLYVAEDEPSRAEERAAYHQCNQSFDGEGGEVAHSLNLDYVHIDDAENFKKKVTSDSTGVYLLKVFVHEIGHIIGLSHNNNPDSVLFPIYSSPPVDGLELPEYDRRVAQFYYGKCNVHFNVVYDHLRRYLCTYTYPNNCDNKYHYRFNSYFFKGDTFWLYENIAGRPRYGDPKLISMHWTGLGNDLDGATQIFPKRRIEYRGRLIDVYDIVTMFFKGNMIYYYSDDDETVIDTKRISDAFGPKPGGNESVPNNIDSVFTDMRNFHMYLFKGDRVSVHMY